MSKSKKKIEEVARAYMNDLRKRFPDLGQELDLDGPPGGYDAWVRVVAPHVRDDSVMAILDATVDLNDSYWQRTGVNIVATVNQSHDAATGRR